MTQEALLRSGSSSDRVRLAQVALAAALAVPDVVRAEAGAGLPRLTAGGPELLIGVSATAQADGRYAIDLRLIARLAPLRPLADHVREGVQAAAARAGLAAALGSVDVEFADVLTAEEIERPTMRSEPAGAALPDPTPSPASPSPQPPAGTELPGS